jgi:Fe-S-cluster-containing hydrogenase component 2
VGPPDESNGPRSLRYRTVGDSDNEISQRLRPDVPLRHEEGACLPLRSRYGECTACAAACPAGVLSVSLHAVSLADGCIGCGRCVAACPTRALDLPGLVREDAASGRTPVELRIECRKVPASLRSPGTLEVACLGALTSGDLLTRHAAGIPVRVVDRGWCGGCEAGIGSAHPAEEALAATATWLEALGVDDPPMLVREPLASARMPHRIPEVPEVPEDAPKLDRRSFFREALQRPAGRSPAPMPMGGNGRAAYPADRRQPSAERQRQLTALRALASERGAEVPAEFFAKLSVDAACCDRRMCVALCPTAALAVAEDGDAARLQFDADRCIGCGTCVRACPERAMHLEPHGGSAGVHQLIEHHHLRCTSCGDRFASTGSPPAEHEGLCPTCLKSRRFVRDARARLFGMSD